jgi:hypothetical protein
MESMLDDTQNSDHSAIKTTQFLEMLTHKA